MRRVGIGVEWDCLFEIEKAALCREDKESNTNSFRPANCLIPAFFLRGPPLSICHPPPDNPLVLAFLQIVDTCEECLTVESEE